MKMDEDRKYICEECDKEFKTRSGLWKHKRKHESPEGVVQPSPDPDDGRAEAPSLEDPTPSPQSIEPDDIPSPDNEEEWLEFSFEVEDATETLPPVLKMIKKQSEQKPRRKMTKAELKVQGDTNIAILKMSLTATDSGLQSYGRAVTMNPEYRVHHSDADKTMVARAQWEYMKEKGIDIGHYISTGGVALALSGWYVGVPLYRIQKERKTSILGKGAGVGRSILSKIPFIGKRFKKKAVPGSEIEEGSDFVP